MEISLDLKADALYIKIREGRFSRNKKVDEETVLDYDSEGRPLGIEILDASKWISSRELSRVKVNLPLKATA